MILIPQSTLGDCHAVFRRVAPKSSFAKSMANVHIVGSRDGIRIRFWQAEIAVEYHHPAPAEAFAFAVPLTALADCKGRGAGTVEFEAGKDGNIEIRWEQSGIPYRREYSVPEASNEPFPAWPGRDVANDPALLEALEEAMRIPTGESGRLSLHCIQLRGQHGEVVATDGRQLLIQGGFRFPWQESLLVPRTPAFGCKELPRGSVVRVAQNKSHVFFRLGGWTIALAIDEQGRFPNVDQVIPKTNSITTQWRVGEEEAPALVEMLDKLPAAKEDHAPVTLDLAGSVVIRARGEEEKRCTEVGLPHSKPAGRHVRIVTDRRFLQRALELGFREVQVTAADKPFLCQEGKRLYVWVPLGSDAALPPQPGALRAVLPALAGKSRRTPSAPVGTTISAPEPLKRAAISPAPVRTAMATSAAAPPAHVPSRPRTRVPGTFFGCAQALWQLVRHHHQKDRSK